MSKVNVTLTDFQKGKIRKAFKNKNNVTVRIQKEQIGGDDILILDEAMMNKIDMINSSGSARDIKIPYSRME